MCPVSLVLFLELPLSPNWIELHLNTGTMTLKNMILQFLTTNKNVWSLFWVLDQFDKLQVHNTSMETNGERSTALPFLCRPLRELYFRTNKIILELFCCISPCKLCISPEVFGVDSRLQRFLKAMSAGRAIKKWSQLVLKYNYNVQKCSIHHYILVSSRCNTHTIETDSIPLSTVQTIKVYTLHTPVDW